MQTHSKFIRAGFFTACLLAAAPVFAQMQSVEKLEALEAGSRWTIPVTTEYASSVLADSDYDKHSEMNVLIEPSYKLSDSWSLLGKFGGYRNLIDSGDSQDADLNNTVLGIKHKWKLNDDLLWSVTASGTLPTNKAQREETSYQGTAKISTAIAWSNLFWGSSLTDSLSYGRNFHEFKQSAAGGFNLRDTVANSVSFNLPLVAKFSFSVDFVYQAAWNYKDDNRFKFVSQESLNYDATERLSFFVALGNEGDALRPNGTDTNIALFDDTTSVVHAGLGYVF